MGIYFARTDLVDEISITGTHRHKSFSGNGNLGIVKGFLGCVFNGERQICCGSRRYRAACGIILHHQARIGLGTCRIVGLFLRCIHQIIERLGSGIILVRI